MWKSSIGTVARCATARAPLAARYASRGRELARPRQRQTDLLSVFDDLFASPLSLTSMSFPRDVFPIDVHETKDSFVVKGDLPGFQTKGVKNSEPHD